MKRLANALERALSAGGTTKEIILLVIGGIALAMSMAGVSPFGFDMAWIAIVLCGVPIVLEAIIGLITAWDIKADVLVSLADVYKRQPLRGSRTASARLSMRITGRCTTGSCRRWNGPTRRTSMNLPG